MGQTTSTTGGESTITTTSTSNDVINAEDYVTATDINLQVGYTYNLTITHAKATINGTITTKEGIPEEGEYLTISLVEMPNTEGIGKVNVTWFSKTGEVLSTGLQESSWYFFTNIFIYPDVSGWKNYIEEQETTTNNTYYMGYYYLERTAEFIESEKVFGAQIHENMIYGNNGSGETIIQTYNRTAEFLYEKETGRVVKVDFTIEMTGDSTNSTLEGVYEVLGYDYGMNTDTSSTDGGFLSASGFALIMFAIIAVSLLKRRIK